MNKLWFKRKRYGWGWTPSSWEGWLVLFIWAIFFIRNTILISGIEEENKHELPQLLLLQILSIVVVIFISYWKGESPRWQWGEKRTDNEPKS